jgi:hypothetical protein
MLSGRQMTDWDLLSDALQLRLAREAMQRAADTIAGHAEQLAGEIESGEITDRGGPEALRLFASVLRLNARDTMMPVGNA